VEAWREAVSSGSQQRKPEKTTLFMIFVNNIMVIGRRSSMMILVMSILMSSDAKSLREIRKLQAPSFEVPLFLALHFVIETTALALETRDSTNDIVMHLCNTVQRQVRR
jgi:hypothetical protein